MQSRNFKTQECKTQQEVESTYAIMRQLRPQISADSYFSRVEKLMKEEKYRLLATYNDEDKCLGVVGFQEQSRLSLGNIIYIADLVTDEAHRSQGIGNHLLEQVRQEAIKNNSDAIVLDSGLQRKQAHTFYQHQGYNAESYSFRLFKPFTVTTVGTDNSKTLSGPKQ
jgi:GNAT superfamily N-acetyltransferase